MTLTSLAPVSIRSSITLRVTFTFLVNVRYNVVTVTWALSTATSPHLPAAFAIQDALARRTDVNVVTITRSAWAAEAEDSPSICLARLWRIGQGEFVGQV
jgi:hypothetical protein